MRMKTIQVVLNKELLEIFRDRRTLIVSIFIPIFMLPMTIGLFTYFIGKRLPEYRYAMIGGTQLNAQQVDSLLNNQSTAKFKRLMLSQPKEALKSGQVEVVMKIPQSLSQAGNEGSVHIVISRGATQESEQAARLASSQFFSYGQGVLHKRLMSRGLTAEQMQPVVVSIKNMEPNSNSSLASIFFPMIVLIWITVGAMYPAADVTAGEKDRGTISDLLLTPASRLEITVGKFLAVLTMSLITLIVATGSTLLAVEIGDIQALSLAKISTPFALLWIIPIAILTTAIVAALEMIASVFAKSFKEAQTYLTPIFMAILVPGGLLAIAPDLAQQQWLYSVPFMNNTLLIRELLLDIVNPVHIAGTLLISLLGSLALLFVIVWLFNQEDVLLRT